MQQQFEGKIEIIGVGGSSSSTADMQDFVDTYGVEGLTHVSDTDNSVWAEYQVFSQPTFAFIDDDGTVDVTRISLGDLVERIEHLIAS